MSGGEMPTELLPEEETVLDVVSAQLYTAETELFGGRLPNFESDMDDAMQDLEATVRAVVEGAWEDRGKAFRKRFGDGENPFDRFRSFVEANPDLGEVDEWLKPILAAARAEEGEVGGPEPLVNCILHPADLFGPRTFLFSDKVSANPN